MNEVIDLEDVRDRTVFIEYFPYFVLTSVWRDNGRLDYYMIGLEYAAS